MSNSWFLFKQEKATLATHVENSHSKGTNFFSESSFHDLLAIERKRAERSKKPFMLLLIDIHHLFRNAAKRSVLKQARRAIDTSSREIDLKGWYESNKVIGVIYTEIQWEYKQLITDKIKKNLTREFSETLAAKVELNAIFFPKKNNDSDDHGAIERLYPELLDKTFLTKGSLVAKRTIDIIGSVFGLILAAPFFITIPILIKATSKGPVFFRQQRVGLGGKTFTFLKFRSMHTNNDPSIHQEFVKKLIRGPSAKSEPPAACIGADTEIFKIVNDPRVTPIGKFIRKTSLDELPQLINVLLGHMSLVGPRPAIPYEVREYAAWHLQRIFPVKPGITGYWQIEGRSHTTFDTMVRMDIHYIKSWSVWLDLKLIFKTPFSVLMAKGAY